MKDWPQPIIVKALRGFPGLTGYYMKFGRYCGSIAKLLTYLTKKGQFGWNDQAEVAFQKLKQAMVTTLVLKLSDFSKVFVVETNASYSGLGTIQMQEKHHLAYISKPFSNKNTGLSIYEKEFLAILLAVEKWRPYLIHCQFIIRIDQNNLMYLVQQKISTPL